MSYDVAACAPVSLSEEEREACDDIVKSGGALIVSAKADISNAEVLVIARAGGVIVGLGVIKQIRRKYASDIAKKSAFKFNPETRELGYVAVDKLHQRKGLSVRIVAELLASFRESLFATTDHQGMKRTLERAGFRQKGNEWLGQRGKLSLWIKD